MGLKGVKTGQLAAVQLTGATVIVLVMTFVLVLPILVTVFLRLQQYLTFSPMFVSPPMATPEGHTGHRWRALRRP